MKLINAYRKVNILNFDSKDFIERWDDIDCLDAPSEENQPAGSTYKFEIRPGELAMTGVGKPPVHAKHEEKTKGGKRAGSGRKALDRDGTVIATTRLTIKQKEKLDRIGGAKWIREQIDMFSE